MPLRLRMRLIDPGVAPALKEVWDNLDDLGPFFRRWFIPQYLKDVQQNFATEGGLVGGWAPLSPEYNAWKEAHYPGRPLNVLKDRIRRTFSLKGRSRYLILEIQRRQAVIGTSHPHAFYVQQVRPFMIPSRMLDSPTYSGLLNQYLEGVLQKAGLRRGRARTTATTPPGPARPSVFGASFFDPPSRWTAEHWRKWPEGPPGSRAKRPEPEDEDEDED